jgi:2,3-bisphosphoglycerate-dependent phosphoglycerate mutase
VRVYLLRHGETDWNVVRRLQGSMDTPLNDVGVRQAAAWRPYFDAIHLAGIYSSSLQRALHTAVLATGRPACITPGFDERAFGDWEGSTWDELKNGVSEFDDQWKEDSFCPPGGESRCALYDRVRSALRETVFEHKNGDQILIVAHGASGHAILGSLLEQSIEARASLPVLHNASLTVVEFHSDRWNLAGQIPTIES